MKIQSINPANGQVNREFETLTPKEALNVCKSVKYAFEDWRNVSLEERIVHVRKFGEVLKAKKEHYARLITMEMGRPIRESPSEIEKCAFMCDVYADNSKKWLAEENVTTEAKKSYVAFEPIGSVFELMPWNFPFWQALRCAIPSVTLGNVCVLRHSNSVPMCALAIEEAFKEAGFPENVFRTIITDHKTVSRIIGSRFIDAVSFTGGTDTAKNVAKIAGKNIKKIVLELGGSDPFIVLEDADLVVASQKAKESRHHSAGQSCTSAKRFIVVKSVANEFIERYVALAKTLVVGDPMNTSTQIGPLANRHQAEKLREQVNDAISKGAKVEYMAEIPKGNGYFYPPTVLSGIKKSMKVAKEEVFGPVSPIFIVKDEKEAIKVANASEYGLGGSVWTKDLERGERVARQIESGLVSVNAAARSDPRLPFGGVKKSGIGRELSRYGLLEFANVKSIIIS